jgi:hypothetical protein
VTETTETPAAVRDDYAASVIGIGDAARGDARGGRSAPQAVPEKRDGGGGRFVEEGDDELNVFGSPLLSPLEHAPVVSMPESATSRFEVSGKCTQKRGRERGRKGKD